MPPALDSMLLDRQPARTAARADRRAGPQRDRHDHPLAAERHVPDRRSRKREHPVECRGDSHVAVSFVAAELRTSSSLPQNGGGGSPHSCATRETRLHDREPAGSAGDSAKTPGSTSPPDRQESPKVQRATELTTPRARDSNGGAPNSSWTGACVCLGSIESDQRGPRTTALRLSDGDGGSRRLPGRFGRASLRGLTAEHLSAEQPD